KLLMVVCNDGAYGAELHHLRKEGVNGDIVVFGRPDLAAIARGFGLQGAVVTDVRQLADLARDYERSDTAAVWDVHINDQVVNPSYRLGNKHAN
ncbi:MAG TPA: thiamine pyrophosphate-dependent enzyme, partial [Xanthobacteraceae bacterium]